LLSCKLYSILSRVGWPKQFRLLWQFNKNDDPFHSLYLEWTSSKTY
jgi:hypothetical protein